MIRFDTRRIGYSIERRKQNECAKQRGEELFRVANWLPHRHYRSAASSLDLRVFYSAGAFGNNRYVTSITDSA